jgi:hypothetical protein
MDLASRISALATSIGGTIKALTARVTTLESRAPVVVLTQAAYDALATKDAGTVYVIKPS